MTYNTFIQNIISSVGQRRKGVVVGIFETHHIIPRCLGGSNDPSNLIDLTPREHFIAHSLLAQENPNNFKLVCAWRYMSMLNKQYYAVTPEEYENARKAIIKLQGKAVYQFSKEQVIIGFYNSAREAARENNLTPSHIIECCNHQRNSAGGYYWQYIEEYETIGFYCKPSLGHSTRPRAVQQLTLDKKEVAKYSSIADAARATGADPSAISSCCKGKVTTVKGYIWRYDIDEE